MRLISLSALVLLAASVFAQDPNGGAHSEVFDRQKYTVLDQLLITPKTHPNLFSFTGRWLRSPTGHPHSPAYHATLWPGNSVTILIFGETVTVKLLPKPQGRVEHYSFVVSIDGGPDVRYNTDGFDTSAQSKDGHYIPIDFNALKKATQKRTAVATLEPHTVRITSIAVTPFSFEGVMVQNTQIAQGHTWEEAQARRPTVEFIGEGIDAERPGGFFRSEQYTPPLGENPESPIDAIYSTIHYKLAENLAVRHSHYSAGVCLLNSCDARKLPGLAEQYFYTSPLDFTGRTPGIIDKWDPRHLENLETPWRFPGFQVKNNIPSLVVVDVGIQDVVMNHQNSTLYARELSVFLARLRSQAHPTAKFLVIAHKGSPRQASTVVKSDFASTANRQDLYAATQNAVKALADPGIIFTPVKLGREEPETSYLRAICPYVAPTGYVAKAREVVFGASQPTKAQKVCSEIGGAEGSGTVLVFLVIVGMCGVFLWMARSTVVGAVAAVVGRKRLGLPEEDARLMEAGVNVNGKVG
ncbi:hypothetical protein FN846DRAFT_324558 [Sphaerosporella brunnea]|uniref:SGNH hydrolase-type esterase domain-containing protein n=1 Tax=Sphaerosporella brunnea TaxID=1250544 RepID=A0A5J5F6L6_9PEZI|nr:hypothetical protein FN846DRAFT_324558 [Sphaerosporella brunnea]